MLAWGVLTWECANNRLDRLEEQQGGGLLDPHDADVEREEAYLMAERARGLLKWPHHFYTKILHQNLYIYIYSRLE